MDFIINHSGFFLGIGVTILLALVGYYADKKDSNKKTSNSSMSTAMDELSGDNKKDVSKNLVDWMDESLPQSGKFINYVNVDNTSNESSSAIEQSTKEETLAQGVSTDTLSDDMDILNVNNIDQLDFSVSKQDNNVSNITNSDLNNQISSNAAAPEVSVTDNNVISFGANDFENIDLSLDDLEKKNFDNFNNSNALDDSENYYYSNLDDSEGSSVMDDSVSSTDDNIVSEDLNVTESVMNEVINETDPGVHVDSDVNGEIVPATSNVNLEAAAEVPAGSDVSHEFDSEVQSDADSEFDAEVQTNNSLEELCSQIESDVAVSDDIGNATESIVSSSDIYDSITDSSDDIWKF